MPKDSETFLALSARVQASSARTSAARAQLRQAVLDMLASLHAHLDLVGAGTGELAKCQCRERHEQLQAALVADLEDA